MDGVQREWRVGELAAATGLTVRALHHFDEIGLLSPALRSTSGHRLYSVDDVKRLYRIVALRQLGLPLERIARSLDGEPQELSDAIAQQLDRVEAQLAEHQRIRSHLAALSMAIQRDELSADQLLDTIEVIMQQNEYFTTDQLGTFRQRHDAVGQAGFAHWVDRIATLAGEAATLARSGVDPADEAAQQLAQRWAAAMADISGGDATIVSAIYGRLDAKGAPAASKGLLSQAAWDYVKRALAVGFPVL